MIKGAPFVERPRRPTQVCIHFPRQDTLPNKQLFKVTTLERDRRHLEMERDNEDHERARQLLILPALGKDLFLDCRRCRPVKLRTSLRKFMIESGSLAGLRDSQRCNLDEKDPFSRGTNEIEAAITGLLEFNLAASRFEPVPRNCFTQGSLNLGRVAGTKSFEEELAGGWSLLLQPLAILHYHVSKRLEVHHPAALPLASKILIRDDRFAIDPNPRWRDERLLVRTWSAEHSKRVLSSSQQFGDFLERVYTNRVRLVVNWIRCTHRVQTVRAVLVPMRNPTRIAVARDRNHHSGPPYTARRHPPSPAPSCPACSWRGRRR